MVARYVGPTGEMDEWSRALAQKLASQRLAMQSAMRTRQALTGNPMYQPASGMSAAAGAAGSRTGTYGATTAPGSGAADAMQTGGANHAMTQREMRQRGLVPAFEEANAVSQNIEDQRNATVGAGYDQNGNPIVGEGGNTDPHGTSTPGNATVGEPAELFPSDSGYNTPAGLKGPITGNNDWYTGRYTEATQEQLAEDPNRWATAYAMANGYGPGVTNLLNSYIDPAAAFLLSLESGEDANNSDAKLGYAGGVSDFALQKSNGVADWEGPQDVIGAILGGSGANPEASPLGKMLYGGANAGNWGNQVKDTVTFLQQALIGRMAPEVMQPYLQNLTLYGERFIEYKAMNPTDTRNFGAWLLDTLGPNAGL